MAKQVKQYRYYGNKDGRNYPTNLSYASLVAGSAFQKTMPVIQLGIQALPGTKFYLNNSNNPIIIGYTGIYELSLEGVAEITSLAFDAKSIQTINDTINAYLIVDMIYEKDGET